MAETSLDTVKVFDTWVNGKQGKLHFDVMTTDEATALRLAKHNILLPSVKRMLRLPLRNASFAIVNRLYFSQSSNNVSSKSMAAS